MAQLILELKDAQKWTCYTDVLDLINETHELACNFTLQVLDAVSQGEVRSLMFL